MSRCPALGSQSASDTAGPAWVCPTVQPEPRLLRKSCETVSGMLEEQRYSQGRGVEMGVVSCSKIQKGKWPSMSSWRRKAGRLVRMNGKGWGSGVGQVTSLSHWCGQSGWETAAPWHPNLTRPLPVSLRSARLHRCRSGEQTSAWQLVKSYLSFMAVSP